MRAPLPWVATASGRRFAGGRGKTRSMGTRMPPTITADVVGEGGKSLEGVKGGGVGGAM